MTGDNINNKSQKMQARVPHDVAEQVEATRGNGESTAQYIVTALRGEIKRRLRKKAKD